MAIVIALIANITGVAVEVLIGLVTKCSENTNTVIIAVFINMMYVLMILAKMAIQVSHIFHDPIQFEATALIKV